MFAKLQVSGDVEISTALKDAPLQRFETGIVIVSKGSEVEEVLAPLKPIRTLCLVCLQFPSSTDQDSVCEAWGTGATREGWT